MKISAINTIKNITYKKFTNKPVSFKQGIDIFVHEKKETEINLPCKIKDKKKFDINDYNKLSTTQIEEIRENLPTDVKKAVKETIFTGKLLKDYFDEIYGEDKYIFACIGTSPSGIGRFMEFSGVETKYFPITGFRGDIDYACNRLNRYPKETEKYLSFLKEKGITPEEIEKNNKIILFTDYTSTGETLNNFEMIVRERAGIGDSDKIKFLAINDELAKADSHFKLNHKKSLRINDYINKYLTSAKICDFTGIPHLQIFDFKNTNKIIKNHKSDKAKLFNFAIIDELNKQGKLIENPLNKNSL